MRNLIPERIYNLRYNRDSIRDKIFSAFYPAELSLAFCLFSSAILNIYGLLNLKNIMIVLFIILILYLPVGLFHYFFNRNKLSKNYIKLENDLILYNFNLIKERNGK